MTKPLLKPVIIAISASLVSGTLLFFLVRGAHPEGKSPGVRVSGAGYAVLTLDDSWPDASIRERLAGKGIVNTIGESSQWVFLDDFGVLEKVPLDSYADRVEPFDPRNDGYADRLRSFFVFQGVRRLFIPLKGVWDIEGRAASALGDIPFSLSILTPPSNRRSPGGPVLPALLFILAGAFTLYFSEEALLILFFLPLWAGLTGLGVPGFALMAVLAGLSRLLREPVRDYFLVQRHGKLSRRPLGTWMGAVPLGILFLFALGGITILGALSPLMVILVLLLFLVLLTLSLWAESHRGMPSAPQGHIRFRLVPITGIPHRHAGGKARRHSPYVRIMAPFTLAALVLLLASAVVPGSTRAAAPVSSEWTGWKSPPALDAKAFAEAYVAHVEFQRTFSLIPLGAPAEPPQAYLRYSLAEDGLIDEAVSDTPGELLDFGKIPPFPLEGLIDFLTNYSYTDPGAETGGLLCLLIVLGLGGSLIFRDRRGPLKLALYMDKRIAA
jgi:hypothetical protein